MMEIANEVLMADNRIRSYIRETPLDYSVALSKMTGANVYLKCENLQYTGSFKVRGAFNKLLSLTSSQCLEGVVTASSGNHGAALAYGCDKLKIQGIVFVPENVSSTKADNIRNYNVQLEFYGTDCMNTELHALEYAKRHNMTYVSPYNNLQIIAGQGTIALEIASQLNSVDAIFVPVGGGGLISGIAGYVKSINPDTKVIGCLPSNSPVMVESVMANRIIEMDTSPTLSDATAGGIEPGAITFDICRKSVDGYVLVSETEIKDAIIALIKTQHLLVEGAAGVALASLIKNSKDFQGKNIVVVLSGANICVNTLKLLLGA